MSWVGLNVEQICLISAPRVQMSEIWYKHEPQKIYFIHCLRLIRWASGLIRPSSFLED